MKYRWLSGLLGLTLLTGVEAGHLQVSLDDIVLLSQRGVSDQTILLLIDNRVVGFVLDADALDKLLLAGVSKEVIRYLFSQNTAVQTATVPPPSTVPYYPVDDYGAGIYPAVAYVESYPGYYYTPYYYGISYSFGFSSYPHTWFGHYSGARHHRTNPHYGGGQHIVHNAHSTGIHSNRHNGHGAGHTGQQGGAHSGGRNRPHATAGQLQTKGHGANKSGHGRTQVTAAGKTHVAARSGRSHIGTSRRSSNHRGGRVHTGSSNRSSSRGGHHGGGHGGGH